MERIGSSGYEVICKGMFKKETDLANLFAGLRVSLSTGEAGKIEDTFGQVQSLIHETRHMGFWSNHSFAYFLLLASSRNLAQILF